MTTFKRLSAHARTAIIALALGGIVAASAAGGAAHASTLIGVQEPPLQRLAAPASEPSEAAPDLLAATPQLVELMQPLIAAGILGSAQHMMWWP